MLQVLLMLVHILMMRGWSSVCPSVLSLRRGYLLWICLWVDRLAVLVVMLLTTLHHRRPRPGRTENVISGHLMATWEAIAPETLVSAVHGRWSRDTHAVRVDILVLLLRRRLVVLLG